MKKWILISVITLIALATFAWLSLDRSVRYLILNPPANENVLFWTTEQRDAGFRAIEQLKILPFNRIEKAEKVRHFETVETPSIDMQFIRQYMEENRTASLIAMHKGKIVLEEYGLDFSAEQKWTSFSVAKSFTSTLVGAAIKDGYIKSLNDKVSDYITSMKGSVYDDVSIEQLLTMTSGVKWNEDYSDPNSDVSRFNFEQPEEGIDATASYMRKLERAAPAGSRWLYSTGETNLIGLLVIEATGKSLSSYLSEKIWRNIGAEQDASWILGPTGKEIGGCCIQATTKDVLRFGQYILEQISEQTPLIVPDTWWQNATAVKAETSSTKGGYGYQWWTSNDGSFQGRGIFGQGLFIDPESQLVIAINSNWTQASSTSAYNAKQKMYQHIRSAVQANSISR